MSPAKERNNTKLSSQRLERKENIFSCTHSMIWWHVARERAPNSVNYVGFLLSSSFVVIFIFKKIIVDISKSTCRQANKMQFYNIDHHLSCFHTSCFQKFISIAFCRLLTTSYFYFLIFFYNFCDIVRGQEIINKKVILGTEYSLVMYIRNKKL